MGMTIAEKILARKSGREEVSPGDVVRAEVDKAMVNDVTAPLTVDVLRELDLEEVWDPDRITIVFDHQFPPTTVEAARNQDGVREFAKRQAISNLYDDAEGVCHQVMIEEAHALPGQLIVGADSHTCTYGGLGSFSIGVGSTDMAAVFAEGELWFRVPETVKIEIRNKLGEHVMPKDLILRIVGEVGSDGAIYKSIEFVGSGIKEIGVSGRLSICNMGVEMGAKASLVPPDERTEEYLEGRAEEEYSFTSSDEDAEFGEELAFDAGNIRPMVACPHNVDKVRPVKELEGVKIHQAFLGSCTNGRFEDLTMAAEILEGRKIAEGVRMVVAPTSREVYQEALREQVIDKLVDAGATVVSPGCAACWGGHVGLLAPEETCVSSSNRNFKGRMGSPEAEIYLASPATVAASALAGEITSPRSV